MRTSNRIAALIVSACAATSAGAAAPNFHAAACSVQLDGQQLSDASVASGLLRNSVAYDAVSGRYQLWVLTTDVNDTLNEVTHATSADGIHFFSDGNLSYGIGSSSYLNYGATIDPPLDFLRGQRDVDSGSWKLFNWTENTANAGQYTYNTSVNDLGSVPANTSVVHQGPIAAGGAGGNEVGAFGLVDGKLYERVDSAYADGNGGGLAPMSYTDAIQPSAPWAPNEATEVNLFAGSPYCWELGQVQATPPTCLGANDIPAYVHNAGRILKRSDGAIDIFYTFRKCTSSPYCGTAERADKQIWYVESTDNGATWSTAQKSFAPDGGAITIDGGPIDNAAGTGNFSGVDAVEAKNNFRVYFNVQDASGKFVVVTAETGSVFDAVFADGFDGCGG